MIEKQVPSAGSTQAVELPAQTPTGRIGSRLLALDSAPARTAGSAGSTEKGDTHMRENDR